MVTRALEAYLCFFILTPQRKVIKVYIITTSKVSMFEQWKKAAGESTIIGLDDFLVKWCVDKHTNRSYLFNTVVIIAVCRKPRKICLFCWINVSHLQGQAYIYKLLIRPTYTIHFCITSILHCILTILFNLLMLSIPILLFDRCTRHTKQRYKV